MGDKRPPVVVEFDVTPSTAPVIGASTDVVVSTMGAVVSSVEVVVSSSGERIPSSLKNLKAKIKILLFI